MCQTETVVQEWIKQVQLFTFDKTLAIDHSSSAMVSKNVKDCHILLKILATPFNWPFWLQINSIQQYVRDLFFCSAGSVEQGIKD